MLGSNPRQLRLRHWLSDSLATRLRYISSTIGYIHLIIFDRIRQQECRLCGCCSCLKTSASLRRAVLMRTGKGYFSSSRGNRTMASLCSPIRGDRSPANNKDFYIILTSVVDPDTDTDVFLTPGSGMGNQDP